jgi:hypothetical protein
MATRFGREHTNPPVVLRDFKPRGEHTGQFLEIDEGPVQLVHMKPADFGGGVVVRLQNFGDDVEATRLRFPALSPSSCSLVSPDERDTDSVDVTGEWISVDVGPRALQSLRITF